MSNKEKYMTNIRKISPRIAPKNALALRNKRFNSMAQILSNYFIAGAIALTTSGVAALFVKNPTLDLKGVVITVSLGILALLVACAMQLIKRYPDEPE